MTDAKDTQNGQTSTLKRYLPLAVIAIVIALAYAFGLHKFLSPEKVAYSLKDIQTYIANNLLIALAIYIIAYIAIVSLSLPVATLLTLTGGLIFGWHIGGLATVIAATIGATIIFLIAKTSLGETMAANAGPWVEKFRKGFQENALSYMLFLRLVPFPFLIINLVPALLGVPLRTYVIGTFIGIIPGTFTIAYLGRGLDSVLEAGRTAHQACLANNSVCEFQFNLSTIVTKDILIALAALGVVSLIPIFLKKLRKSPT